MEVVGGRVVAASGSGRFLKLDGKDGGGFVYSVKATETIRETALRAIARLWREAVQGTRGPAGHGDGAKPGVIFELDGELLVLVRLEDHAALATGEAPAYVPLDKAAERRRGVLKRLQ
jgi:hypothetical protein